MTKQKTADPLATHLIFGQTVLTPVYLASPYSSKQHPPGSLEALKVQTTRFKLVAKAAAWLMQNDARLNVFSPIVNSHILHVEGGLGGDWNYWKVIDTDYIFLCDLFIVLCIDGWRESTGVKAEIEIAQRFDMDIMYLQVVKPVSFGGDIVTTGGYKLSKRAPK